MNFCFLIPTHHRLTMLGFLVLALALLTPLPANPASPTPMSSSPEYTLVQVPARIAGLEFSFLKAADFNPITLPDETPDFEQPAVFMPLQVVMASYGAVLFSVGARPAYGDGTVEDWAEFLARELKMNILSLKPATVAGMPAMLMESLQQSEMGEMRIRTALIEDGTRMLNLSIMAPASIWASVEPTLQMMFSSFRLTESRGATAVLTRAAAAAASATATVTEPEAAAVAEPVTSGPSESASTPTAAADLALADDAGTFDPEHRINANLRDRGVGLTARVLETDLENKYAVLGAGALVSTVRVPFGWHVIDDGKRTLVFDAGGKIQVSLNLRRTDGQARALLNEILAETREAQPAIDPQEVDFAPDLPGLVLRNYRDGDDVLVQVFVVRELRDDGLAHVARVTAAPEDMDRAMNLTELIMRSLSVPHEVAQP